MRNFKKAWQEVKKGAPREFGLFLFMLAFGLCAAVVFFPLIWLMNKMPDWAWVVFVVGFFVWVVFGDTLGRACSALRGDDND